eukprot:3091038-Rhodomonas_salina.3
MRRYQTPQSEHEQAASSVFRRSGSCVTDGHHHRLWRPNMKLEEGIELMKKVFAEINTRFLVGGSTFTLKVESLAVAFRIRCALCGADRGWVTGCGQGRHSHYRPWGRDESMNSSIQQPTSGAVDSRLSLVAAFFSINCASCLLYTSPSPRDRG